MDAPSGAGLDDVLELLDDDHIQDVSHGDFPAAEPSPAADSAPKVSVKDRLGPLASTVGEFARNGYEGFQGLPKSKKIMAGAGGGLVVVGIVVGALLGDAPIKPEVDTFFAEQSDNQGESQVEKGQNNIDVEDTGAGVQNNFDAEVAEADGQGNPEDATTRERQGVDVLFDMAFER